MKSVNEDKNLGDAVVDRETEQGLKRELDTAIAERVMGWQWMKRVGQNCAWLFPPNSTDVDTGEKGLFGEPIIRRGHIVGPFEIYDGQARKQSSSDIPRYSSSIDAAMEVVEKMRTLGFRWNAQTPHGAGWEIQCYRPAQRGKGEKFRGLLPEAICRAALHATECLSISDRGTNGQASLTKFKCSSTSK